jgi:hypothetical protein
MDELQIELLPDSEDSDDENFEVCFYVEKTQFFTFKSSFMKLSPKFREISEEFSPNEQILVELPVWSQSRSFQIVLDFVNFGEMFWASGSPHIEGQNL